MTDFTNRRTSPRSGFDRRRFLHGLGVAVALPWFESLIAGSRMATAAEGGATGAVTATGAPLRMAFLSIPNGVQQEHWFPDEQFRLNDTMAPLESLKEHFQVISGLDHVHATAGPDGAGDHARASATFLTGQRARKTAGSDIRVGISVDQLAAQRLGNATRLPSLELTSDVIRNSGSCDSGYACAYQYNLAWSSPTTPVTPEANPRLVFERLFGAGDPADRQRNYTQRQATQHSVLDFVLEEARDMERQLAVQDRRKFDEYLTIVRDVERRIKAAEQAGGPPSTEEPVPAGIPGDFGDHMDLMCDMMALAFQTDSTRIATLLLAYDGSNRSFPHLGIAEGHHYLTHSQRKPELAKKVAQIDQFYIGRLARLLEKLNSIQDTDGRSVLYNSMIVYGGAIADGNKHTHDNLPVILAGHAGGALATGRHLKVDSQPMSNLFVSMLDYLGSPVEQFGDSTSRLEAIHN